MTAHRDAILSGTEHLVRTGRFELAIEQFERFVRDQPGAWPMAAMLADLFRRAGETAAAEGRSTEAIAYFTLVANWRAARGDRLGAAELRARVDHLELDDIEAQLELVRMSSLRSREMQRRAALARACIAQGNAAGAAEHLTADMAEEDPAILLTIAELLLRGGKLDKGIALAERVIADDPSLADAVARLGAELAAHEPDAGFLLVEMVRLQHDLASSAG